MCVVCFYHARYQSLPISTRETSAKVTLCSLSGSILDGLARWDNSRYTPTAQTASGSRSLLATCRHIEPRNTAFLKHKHQFVSKCKRSDYCDNVIVTSVRSCDVHPCYYGLALSSLAKSVPSPHNDQCAFSVAPSRHRTTVST